MQSVNSRRRVVQNVLPLLLLVAALVWYAALVLRFHTHGAIGTDPITYVQMARDLVQNGTLTHQFPLFNNSYDKGLSWDAFITPGYRIVAGTGAIAPTFAFGFPLLLAAAMRVLGEGAANWTTPLLGLLSLLATLALGNELCQTMSAWKRYTIGGLAVLLLATSPKQIQLTLVTMSDVPTQLFCVLAIFCALRVARCHFARSEKSCFFFAALCGFTLGFGYLLRHSAISLIVPLALIAWRWGNSRRERIILLVVALVVLALTLLPDFLYRTNTLDSPFAVESPDSAQLSFAQVPQQVLGMILALFSVTGFGPAATLALVGWWSLFHANLKWEAWILIAWLLVFMLFHAPLQLTGVFENNLRYLLPAYPAIALSIGVGTVWVFEQTASFAPHLVSRRGIAWSILTILVLVGLGIALRALLAPERFVARSYGWMSETARADLDTQNQTLPRDAVIGVSDQMAGAVTFYLQRDIFRPNSFVNPTQEFPRFLELMRTEGRAVYIIGEWNCLPDATASEMLPAWLAGYNIKDQNFEIRDLPYECPQKIYQIQ